MECIFLIPSSLSARCFRYFWFLQHLYSWSWKIVMHSASAPAIDRAWYHIVCDDEEDVFKIWLLKFVNDLLLVATELFLHGRDWQYTPDRNGSFQRIFLLYNTTLELQHNVVKYSRLRQKAYDICRLYGPCSSGHFCEMKTSEGIVKECLGTWARDWRVKKNQLEGK